MTNTRIGAPGANIAILSRSMVGTEDNRRQVPAFSCQRTVCFISFVFMRWSSVPLLRPTFKKRELVAAHEPSIRVHQPHS